MVEVDEEQWVTDRLARRMYLRYCQGHDRRPFRKNYAPPWAKDYASVAVSVLGYDDEAIRRLADANDTVVTP